MDNLIKNMEKSLAHKRVLVIGDVMMDAYLFGAVNRISPEAPVPIVNLATRDNRLGGAANVALNIQALGAKPILCSVVGDDEKGKEFIQLMISLGLSTECMITSNERITTVKFRIIGNNVQLLRVDEEIDCELIAEDRDALLLKISRFIQQGEVDAIIFEDYDKGVISKSLIESVINMASKANIPVAVDPKKRNFNHYQGSTIFKPNLKELKEGTKANINFSDIHSLISLVESYLLKNQIKIALITLSEKGVLIVWQSESGYQHKLIPAHHRNIVDVSGAGDTVISVATLCLSLGFSPESIASIANLSGGLVCEEVGVVPVNKEKLMHEISRLQLLSIG